MDFNEIKKILAQYEQGNCSTGEEQVLRQFFQETPIDKLPNEWKVYPMIFDAWEEELSVKIETPDFEEKVWNAINQNTEEQPTVNQRWITRRLQVLSSIAASLLLLAAVFLQQPKEEKPVLAQIDGKNITDPDIAYLETKKALMMLSKNFNKGTDNLEDLSMIHKVQVMVAN